MRGQFGSFLWGCVGLLMHGLRSLNSFHSIQKRILSHRLFSIERLAHRAPRRSEMMSSWAWESNLCSFMSTLEQATRKNQMPLYPISSLNSANIWRHCCFYKHLPINNPLTLSSSLRKRHSVTPCSTYPSLFFLSHTMSWPFMLALPSFSLFLNMCQVKST